MHRSLRVRLNRFLALSVARGSCRCQTPLPEEPSLAGAVLEAALIQAADYRQLQLGSG